MSGKLQKGNKDIYYHEWLKRLIRREAVISQILGLTTSDSDPSLWTQELQEYYNSMNNGLSFEFHNLINALQQLEGASIIPLSKTVWVNLDLTASDTNSRRFKTYAEAITWIQANGGTLSASNTWTIKLPSGLITEPLVKLPFIEFEVSAGTIIDELISGVAYSTSADFFKAGMQNAQINTLVIPSGMCMALVDCNTSSIEIEDDTCNLFVQGGVHADLDLGNSDCDFYNVRIWGSIFSNFNNADFTRSTIESDVTIALGETLTLIDSVCDSITNNGTLKNYQPTYDSDLVADATTKGCRKYTETANSSSFEIVMQTGASTYEWVVIKTNTW